MTTWLWTPRWRHDSKRQNVNDGSEHLNVNNGSERLKIWRQTPDHDRMMALNVKLGRNGGFESPNREEMVALDAETENVTLNVKLRNATLNVKLRNVNLNITLKTDDGSERQNWKATMMVLNAETEKWQWWLWTSKLKSDGGSERRKLRMRL